MSDALPDFTSTCVVCDNVFTPAELDRIISQGEALLPQKAVLAGEGWAERGGDHIRITRTSAFAPSPETKWLFDRMQAVIRQVNEQVYQFDVRGFSENFQYTVYHGTEGGHYDWHIDWGLKNVQRKLSLSLQLSDPGDYEGCDLQFQGMRQIETAPRNRGAVIVFPSFILHRVTPITAGTRKSLVVWTAGPKFR